MNRTSFPQDPGRPAVSRAKFLHALGACEGSERRLTALSWKARDNLDRVITSAGLTAIYVWSCGNTPRMAALCLDSTGRFFAVEFNRVEPVTVAQGWAFMLACREWSDHRNVEDREAACRWEEAILRQLQRAELAAPAHQGA